MGLLAQRLVSLQEAENEVRKFKGKITEIERAMIRKSGEVRKLKEEYEQRVIDKEELIRKRVGLERALEVVLEEQKKFKTARNMTKSNKLYVELTAAIVKGERDIAGREDRILDVFEEIESRESLCKQILLGVEVEYKKFQEVLEVNKVKVAELLARLSLCKMRREQVSSQLPIQAYDLFNRLSKRMKGDVVVGVMLFDEYSDEEATYFCKGCRLSVTLEQVNQATVGEDVVQCQHCSRILAWRKQEENSIGALELPRELKE